MLISGDGNAGSLEINANSMTLDNGTITTANANGTGGILTINTDIEINSIKVKNHIFPFTVAREKLPNLLSYYWL